MPRISNIELIEQPEQHVLSIRKTGISAENLPMTIGESYGKLAAYLKQKNITIADVPFVCYYNMDMQNLDVEFLFPVARPTEGEGEIMGRTIPIQKAVTCMYLGAYSQIEPTYNEIIKWSEDNSIESAWIAYEYYYNAPDRPENELLTKIVTLVK